MWVLQPPLLLPPQPAHFTRPSNKKEDHEEERAVGLQGWMRDCESAGSRRASSRGEGKEGACVRSRARQRSGSFGEQEWREAFFPFSPCRVAPII